MATINLGAIKFNWKGAYAGGTAYTVDDVVSSGGSSYVCILASTGNATSNGTYWELMAQVGTAGAEGGSTTLTTQGDILYRDGSGLQRLAKGTAGQVLQMNSGATAPEYATASSGGGKLKALHVSADNTQWNSSNSSWNNTGSSITWTPSSTTNKYIVFAQSAIWRSSGGGYASWKMVNSGGNTSTIVRNGDITSGTGHISFPATLTSPENTTGTTSSITTTLWIYPNGIGTYWSNDGGIQDGILGGKNRWFIYEYEA